MCALQLGRPTNSTHQPAPAVLLRAYVDRESVAELGQLCAHGTADEVGNSVP
jgi:hypothetical protein